MYMSIALFLVDGLLVLGLLWFCISYLYRYREYISSNFSAASRFISIFRLVMAMPPLIILLITILFVFVLKNDLFVRFAHAFFLLGMWAAFTVLIFTFFILMRLRSPLLFIGVLALLGTFLPISLFTSILNFQATFGQAGTIGYLLPFIEGLLMVACCYPLLLRLNRTLHG